MIGTDAAFALIFRPAIPTAPARNVLRFMSALYTFFAVVSSRKRSHIGNHHPWVQPAGDRKEGAVRRRLDIRFQSSRAGPGIELFNDANVVFQLTHGASDDRTVDRQTQHAAQAIGNPEGLPEIGIGEILPSLD